MGSRANHPGRWVGRGPTAAQAEAEAVTEVSELGITLPDDVVEAIAAAIAHELAGRLSPESETAEPWRLLSLEDAAARLGRSTR